MGPTASPPGGQRAAGAPVAAGRTNGIARLARPGGGLAMVALDQRESLRAYLRAAGAEADDEALVRFKAAAIRDLGGAASGVLVDLDYGLPALQGDDPPGLAGGLILAADLLVQDSSGAIVDTELDERIEASLVEQAGCVALKLLLIWHGDAERDARLFELTARFVGRCHELGMLALVEPVMDAEARTRARSLDGDLYAAMARQFGGLDVDIYKTEVPADPTSPEALIAERAGAVTAALACPWVVLSNGVEPGRFPAVTRAVCEGGASGFLAGRAIWRPSLGALGYDAASGASHRQLAELSAIVDALARPVST